MIKSIIKEILIIVLLIIATVILLGIVFYEYNPINKKVPSDVEAYVLPEKTAEELNETLEASQTQNIIKTYRIDAKDLKGFEKTNDYEKGKLNPFDKVWSDGTRHETNEISDGNLSDGENNSSGSSNNTGNSGGHFFNTIK